MTARTRQHRAWDSAEVGRALMRSVRGAEEKSPKRPPRCAGRLRCPLSRWSPRSHSSGGLRLGGGSAVSAAKSHRRRMRPGSPAGAPRPRSTHRAVILNALRPRWGNDPNGLEWTAEAGSPVSGCQPGCSNLQASPLSTWVPIRGGAQWPASSERPDRFRPPVAAIISALPPMRQCPRQLDAANATNCRSNSALSINEEPRPRPTHYSRA